MLTVKRLFAALLILLAGCTQPVVEMFGGVSGETAGQVSSVVVTVSRDGIDKGSYSESIVVTSNGGTAVVKVKEPSLFSVGHTKRLMVP